MSEPLYKDEDWLYEEYIEKGRSQVDMGDDCGVSPTTIKNYLMEYDISRDKPWRDRSKMEELYVEKEMTATEIADEFGCMQKTILTWLDRHDIDVRWSSDYVDRPYDDENVLREMYVEKGMGIKEIADEFGCTESTIYDHLVSYGIDTSQMTYETKLSPSGYVCIRCDDSIALIHRLVAVVKYGMDAMSGKVVHHKNSIPWDNRPENLELLDRDEHSSHHINERIERGEQLFVKK